MTYGPDVYNAVWVANVDADKEGATDIGIDGFNGATLNNDLASGLATFGKDDTDSWLQATVTFKGIEAQHEFRLDTLGGDGYSIKGTSITAEMINKAIISTVNEDDELGALLFAKDGAGHSLIIESLVNGKFAEDDLTVSLGLANDTDAKKGDFVDFDEANEWYGGVKDHTPAFATERAADDHNTAYGDDNVYDGFDNKDDADLHSQVIVDGGAGNDVIVLGPNGAKDIVVLNDKLFGTDTVFGFETALDIFDVSGLGIKEVTYVASTKDFGAAGTYFVKTAVNGITDNAGKLVEVNKDGAITHTYGTICFDDDVDVSKVELLGTAADPEDFQLVLDPANPV